jgi:hypothetical protein
MEIVSIEWGISLNVVGNVSSVSYMPGIAASVSKILARSVKSNETVIFFKD